MVERALPNTAMVTMTILPTLVHLALLPTLVSGGFLEAPSSVTVTAAEPARLGGGSFLT